MPAQLYRHRQPVRAIQYKPHQNCAEVAEFTGKQEFFTGPCPAKGSGQAADDAPPWLIHELPGYRNFNEAEAGEWIVKHPNGDFDVYTPEEFAAEFEPVEE